MQGSARPGLDIPVANQDNRVAANLPYTVTPFIGRQAEAGEILQMLAMPDCRLLTLVGAGGIGKTRLALHVAQQLVRAGTQVIYVDLQPVQEAHLLSASMADALGLVRSKEEPKAQLLQVLRHRKLVFVLDNFEQLLGECDYIDELLRAAPGIKLLVTSRMVLHLQGEWQYPVGGLHYPAPNAIQRPDARALADYDAIRLFVACAQRVRPDFQLQTQMDGVVGVCRMVGGMPLAIELAATWTRSMPVSAIAQEIQRDLDFLATPLRNIPERHRSMQAVFARSWQILNEKERSVFKRLSVFRGGFDAGAAIFVAGATQSILAALVDKSLLRWCPEERFEQHELLRQYAADQLAQSEEDLASTRGRHSRYYTGFLGNQLNALSTQQQAAMACVQAELDNIRAAWQWATAHADLAALHRAGFAFFAFCQGQSRYREGVEMLAAADRAVATEVFPSPAHERTRAELLAGRGWLALRLGRLQEVEEVLKTAVELYESQQLVPAPVMGTDPLPPLSVLAAVRGDYSTAATLGEQAWTTAAARDDLPNLALAAYALTSVAIAQGRYEEALDHAGKTLALAERVGNRWFTAYIHNQMGEITQTLGDIDTAKGYFEASYAMRKEFADPEGMAAALNHLGEIALTQKDYAGSRQQYTQSLEIYQNIGDQGGLVQAHCGLGMAAHGSDEVAVAQRHLQQALQIATDARILPLLLAILVDIGDFLIDRGAPDQGAAALAMAQAHPASHHTTREKAGRLLTAYGVQPAPVSPQNLDSITAALVARLSSPMANGATGREPLRDFESYSQQGDESAAPAVVTRAQQPLLEPLSEREQEVLALVAFGLKNREIAKQLTVTLGTVKAHINHIYGKLGVRNRVEAVSRSRELGLL